MAGATKITVMEITPEELETEILDYLRQNHIAFRDTSGEVIRAFGVTFAQIRCGLSLVGVTCEAKKLEDFLARLHREGMVAVTMEQGSTLGQLDQIGVRFHITLKALNEWHARTTMSPTTRTDSTHTPPPDPNMCHGLPGDPRTPAGECDGVPG